MLTKRLPEITFHTRVRDRSIPGDNPFRWQHKTTAEIFAGKRSILFSLPAAFSPTCTDRHVPRYEELAEQFNAFGVDQIVCVSVNDAFVMFQWGKKVGVKQIVLLPDGNGEFTRRMGMLIDRSLFGMGMRSWRYSLLLNGLEIETAFVEDGIDSPNPQDPLNVSDADTMMAHLQSLA